MGVRGLSTFMGQNPHLFRKFHLHACKVVIDGNNLCHKLFHEFRIDSYLGGDYNLFHARVVQYFEAYRKCNVTIYVIFDGAYDVNDRKLKTTIERAKQRLAAVKRASRGVFANRTLPILALEVFRDVLIEMKISFAHSDFEADDQIVALANRLQCPVMSQDSDFFIYDLTNGYIQLDSLDINIKLHKSQNDGYRYMKAKIYYLDRLLGSFENLNRSVLPLYGAMLGNDFIDIDTLSSFFRNVSLPRKVDCKLIIANRQSKMFGLLAWLQTVTADQAIEKVLHFLKTEDRKVVKQAILKGMEGYNVCGFSLLNHLGLLTDEEISSSPDKPLITIEKNELPEWLCQKFRSGDLPPFFLNALVRRRVFLLAQVEDWTQASSYACSLAIRRILYGFGISLDIQRSASKSEVDNDCNNNRFITEFGQNAGLPNKTNVQPLLELQTFGKVPSLENVQRLSTSNKLSLLLEMLKVSNENFHTALPGDWELLLCAVVFWLKSVATKVSMQFLNAVIVMALYFYLQSPISKKICKKNKKSANIEVLNHPGAILNAEELFGAVLQKAEHFSSCLKGFSKFQNEPRINNKHPPDLKGLHWFSELQTCFLFSSYLNRLLDLPVQHFQPSHFLNGTFLYNAYQDLKNRSKPDTYLEELFVKDSLMHLLFLKIRDSVLEEVGGDCVVVMLPVIGRKARRKRKATKKAAKQYESNSDDSDLCDGNCSPLLHAACELSNKYQHLNASDI